MQQFEELLLKISQLSEEDSYFKVKRQFVQDQEVQVFLNEHWSKLFELLNACAYTKSCYTGFTILIACELIADGQLNINKPEPPKAVKKKKKKGKKAPAPAEPLNTGPPPEPMFISSETVRKLFLLSQRPTVNEATLSRGSAFG